MEKVKSIVVSLLSVILVLGIAPPATAKGEPNLSEITAE